MNAIFGQLITMGDAASQFIGRCIPVYYNGRLHHFTRTANESISGAADWHRQNGRWPWVADGIDAIFWLWESNHCRKARANDVDRAFELLKSNGYKVTL